MNWGGELFEGLADDRGAESSAPQIVVVS